MCQWWLYRHQTADAPMFEAINTTLHDPSELWMTQRAEGRFFNIGLSLDTST